MFTIDIVNEIKSIKEYSLIDFEINIDGTACLLVKGENGCYYQDKIKYSEMKMSVKDLAKILINNIEAYFNGLAFKRGFV